MLARIDRLRGGLRGDWKSVGGGVIELRIDHGPGYRIYCAADGARVIVLLAGGTKRSQASDIEIAHEFWKDYCRRERTVPRR